VRERAERHGCRYLSRSERHHAKAGNLNAGLAASNGELVAVFDADFVPQRQFLERTVGLLQEPDVGLVQTPQVFFNADPLLRNLAMERWMLPDEDNFYRWIEPVRSAWGAVVCAGTSFVARRQALDQVGGFVEAALSEDFVTGIALLGRGWRVRYLGEPLSAGLAAETLLDFVRQRQRWAAGTLQSLRLPQGPLRQGGLGPAQRLALLEGCLHWLSTLPRLLVLLMPLSYGLLGVVPINISSPGVMTQLLPLWLSTAAERGLAQPPQPPCPAQRAAELGTDRPPGHHGAHQPGGVVWRFSHHAQTAAPQPRRRLVAVGGAAAGAADAAGAESAAAERGPQQRQCRS
jgi:cellulose synthase (UDP-forming)